MADIDNRTALISQSNPTRIADLPSNVKTPVEFSEAKSRAGAVGEELYKSPSFTGAVQSKEVALQELYNFDKRLETQQEGPTAGMAREMYGQEYVPNYADVVRGAGQEATGIGRAVGTSQRAIEKVSGMYDAAMADVMSKFLDFYKLREQRKARQQDREDEEKKRKEDRALNIISMLGGDYTDPDTGKTYHFPTPEEKKALDAKYRAPREKSFTERLYEKEEPVRKEIAKFLSIQGSRTEAEEAAKDMVGRGYDPEIVYEELDRMFPKQEEDTTSKEQEELNKELRDAKSVIDKGADFATVKRRFLEKYPTKSSLFDTYIYGY